MASACVAGGLLCETPIGIGITFGAGVAAGAAGAATGGGLKTLFVGIPVALDTGGILFDPAHTGAEVDVGADAFVVIPNPLYDFSTGNEYFFFLFLAII